MKSISVTELGDIGSKATCIYVLILEFDLIKNVIETASYMFETFPSTNFHLDLQYKFYSVKKTT